jgi:N-acetylmuramic acid 6-phosphate (MurNAc-6-P) etherase
MSKPLFLHVFEQINKGSPLNMLLVDVSHDLESLKERSKNMVVIAEQIKTKLARKELNVESDEIKEI